MMNLSEAVRILEIADQLMQYGSKLEKKYSSERGAETAKMIYSEYRKAVKFLKKLSNDSKDWGSK